MVKKVSAKEVSGPLDDFISRNRGSTELKVNWSQLALNSLEEMAKIDSATLVECMKTELKADISFYGYGELEAKGGYETGDLDWSGFDPWVPGHPTSGLFGNVYELKGTDGNVLTVIADFQELCPNFWTPPNYFKCHLEDGTTLRVPHRDILAHRLKAGRPDVLKVEANVKLVPSCDEIAFDIDVGPEGATVVEPSSIGLASPTDEELTQFIERCKPRNRSGSSLTLFLRRFESYLAMYEREFKVDRSFRASCEHENVANVPKNVEDHHRRRRRP